MSAQQYTEAVIYAEAMIATALHNGMTIQQISKMGPKELAKAHLHTQSKAADGGLRLTDCCASFDRRKGRPLVVDGVRWKWRAGKGGGVVAHSERGKRLQSQAWTVKGITDPEIFARGQWKRTSDGMVKPADVAAWISSHN